jgi:hypothetical protein
LIVAVSLTDGDPLRATVTPVPGCCTPAAISDWVGAHLASTSTVVSDGRACVAGFTDNGCIHQPTVVGTRKPKEVQILRWLNTMGSLQTGFSGDYHRVDCGTYPERHFDMLALPTCLLAESACVHAPNSGFGACPKSPANQLVP